MRLAIMQPYFFPYIGYWQLVNAVDKFIIYDDVNYIKRGWINRNSVLINNESKYINLSLVKASINKYISQISIVAESKKNLMTLERCYKKAPYFYNVMPIIEDILKCEETNLAQFLGQSIEKVSDYLNIKTKFTYSSTIKKKNELKGQEKILEICKILEVDEYINSIGGQSLYSKDKFTNIGINLSFIKPSIIKYKQFNNKFIPNLSIIDVMMFNSAEKIQEYLNSYDLT